MNQDMKRADPPAPAADGMKLGELVRDGISHFAETLRKIEIEEAALEGALTLLASTQLPVICTGVGKSGLIAAKFVATLNSLGLRATFLNPTDALHGDLGFVVDESPVVMFSNSGATLELRNLLPALQARNCRIISIVSNGNSPLAKVAAHVLNYGAIEEIDEHRLAPTTSTVVQLAIAETLAATVSRARGFQQSDFHRNHPAGALGKRLMSVEALMRQGSDLPRVRSESPLVDVLATISAKRIGCTCVVDDAGKLAGLITDGDIRHALEKRIDVYGSVAGDIMRVDPQVARPGMRIEDLLEDSKYLARHFTIPIVDEAHMLLGIVVSIDLI